MSRVFELPEFEFLLIDIAVAAAPVCVIGAVVAVSILVARSIF